MMYTCENVEVTLEGFVDVLVTGRIEWPVIGTDNDGEPIRGEHVTIESVCPVVMRCGYVTYSDYSLDVYRICWRDALVQAILDRAQADDESRHELR